MSHDPNFWMLIFLCACGYLTLGCCVGRHLRGDEPEQTESEWREIE